VVQQKLIRGADGARTLGALIEEIAASNGDTRDVIARDARTLVERGILDLA
jgi:hypothetical protein